MAAITAAQRGQIAAALFDLHPALTPAMIDVYVLAFAAPGTPLRPPVRSLSTHQADALIRGLRSVQARRRPFQAIA